jgi:hypothetical protein
MTLGFVYWLILIIAVLFGGWTYRGSGDKGWAGPYGISLVLFVLIGLQLFGFPIHR